MNKLFTTKWPLSHFLQLIAAWSHAQGIALQPSHIPGKKNTWADDLSCDRPDRFAFRRSERNRFTPCTATSGPDVAPSNRQMARGASRGRTPLTKGASLLRLFLQVPPHPTLKQGTVSALQARGASGMLLALKREMSSRRLQQNRRFCAMEPPFATPRASQEKDACASVAWFSYRLGAVTSTWNAGGYPQCL